MNMGDKSINILSNKQKGYNTNIYGQYRLKDTVQYRQKEILIMENRTKIPSME